MEILAAYDLTGSLRAAAEPTGWSHHTVARHVAARDADERVTVAGLNVPVIPETAGVTVTGEGGETPAFRVTVKTPDSDPGRPDDGPANA